jgi:hypothetical protein
MPTIINAEQNSDGTIVVVTIPDDGDSTQSNYNLDAPPEGTTGEALTDYICTETAKAVAAAEASKPTPIADVAGRKV